MGHMEGLETSGQCMAEWSIMDIAMDMMPSLQLHCGDVHQLQQIIDVEEIGEMGSIGLGGEG